MNINKIILMGLFAAVSVQMPAKNIYVSSRGSDSNNGQSALQSYATLAKAVSSAATGDVILLTGTLQPDTTITINGNKVLTFEGSDTEMGNNIIDGGEKAGIFNISNGAKVTFRNLVLRNGKAAKQGGAIYTLKATVTIDNCDIYNNKTAFVGGAQGGAIYSYNSTVDITNTTFYGNQSYNGGAFYALSGTLKAMGTTFERNETHLDDQTVTRPSEARGGAVSFTNLTSASFEKCEFLYNQSTGDGGALCIYSNASNTVDIDECAIIGNKSGLGTINGMSGGAIMYMSYGALVTNIRSTTIGLNQATAYGGVLFNSGDADGAKVNFVNCTIYKNSTLGNAGNVGGLNMNNKTKEEVNFVNTIVENNTCSTGATSDVLFGTTKVTQLNSSIGTGKFAGKIAPQMDCQYHCFPLMADSAWTTAGDVAKANEYGCLSDQNGYALSRACLGAVQTFDNESFLDQPSTPTAINGVTSRSEKLNGRVVDINGRVLKTMPDGSRLVKRADDGTIIVVK